MFFNYVFEFVILFLWLWICASFIFSVWIFVWMTLMFWLISSFFLVFWLSDHFFVIDWLVLSFLFSDFLIIVLWLIDWFFLSSFLIVWSFIIWSFFFVIDWLVLSFFLILWLFSFFFLFSGSVSMARRLGCILMLRTICCCRFRAKRRLFWLHRKSFQICTRTLFLRVVAAIWMEKSTAFPKSMRGILITKNILERKKFNSTRQRWIQEVKKKSLFFFFAFHFNINKIVCFFHWDGSTRWNQREVRHSMLRWISFLMQTIPIGKSANILNLSKESTEKRQSRKTNFIYLILKYVHQCKW